LSPSEIKTSKFCFGWQSLFVLVVTRKT